MTRKWETVVTAAAASDATAGSEDRVDAARGDGHESNDILENCRDDGTLLLLVLFMWGMPETTRPAIDVGDLALAGEEMP